MSSRCISRSWSRGTTRFGDYNRSYKETKKEVDDDDDDDEEEEEGGTKEGRKFCYNSPHARLHDTSRIIHMSNYGVRELTWENGQLTVHGLGKLMQPNASANKPIWTESLSGCETLESVVHQAAIHSKLQSQGGLNHDSGHKDGQGARKRPHSDADLWFGFQEESPGLGQSASAGASRTNDQTRTMSWASYESSRSLKTAKTGDKDYVRSGSETQDTEGEEQETKGETGRSCIRRGRAAAIHNASERRRRNRINQRMKTLQKLLPDGSKTDKVSILDDVIEHLKQLQAQVQLMTMRSNLPQQMMMSHPLPQPPQSVLGMQHQQQQFQMALLTTMARMGMGTGGAFGGGFAPPPPSMVPPMTNRDSNTGSSATIPDPYSAFVAQIMNMDLYNKMAAAIYKQQSDQATQVTTTSIPSNASIQEQGD